jgi:hypothetical protein
MNALELADELEAAPYYTFFEGEAATILRQQHAEIEALKAEAIKLVMSEHCTCYKLGYSPLNNYRKIEQNENKS